LQKSVLLHLRQPETKKRVYEVAVCGPIGRWLQRHRWGAFTLPFPFVVFIFYWNTNPPHPLVRTHEFVHVRQDEASPFFLVFWVTYLAASLRHLSLKTLLRRPGAAFMAAYRANRFEVEAYRVEAHARANGPPEWASGSWRE
jgi:hypothetical protein